MPDFAPQSAFVSPVPASDGPIAPLSVPFPAKGSNANNRHPAKSIGDIISGFNSRSTVSGNSNAVSGADHDHSAQRAAADPPSAENEFLQLDDATSNSIPEGLESSIHSLAGSTDNTSSTGAITVSSRHCSEISSTTSVHSAKQQKYQHPANPAKVRKLSTTKSTQGVFSDSPIPSHQQTLELVEIFWSNHHHFLPCIHRRSLLDRIERGASVQSDPLLQTILATAAPMHSDHQIQALRDNWLARAQTLFEKNLSFNTFPTQSLQAAVWIIFCAFVAGELTEAWFFLGKACRFAHFLGCDRVDSGRSERLVTITPQVRDTIELEERRKAVWALFLFDRSLSCLAGFSLAIDDRHFHVNFPVDDAQFQAITDSVSLTRSPMPFP